MAYRKTFMSLALLAASGLSSTEAQVLRGLRPNDVYYQEVAFPLSASVDELMNGMAVTDQTVPQPRSWSSDEATAQELAQYRAEFEQEMTAAASSDSGMNRESVSPTEAAEPTADELAQYRAEFEQEIAAAAEPTADELAQYRAEFEQEIAAAAEPTTEELAHYKAEFEQEMAAADYSNSDKEWETTQEKFTAAQVPYASTPFGGETLGMVGPNSFQDAFKNLQEEMDEAQRSMDQQENLEELKTMVATMEAMREGNRPSQLSDFERLDKWIRVDDDTTNVMGVNV